MKLLITGLVLAAAVVSTGCDRARTQGSAYNNSGASATGEQPATTPTTTTSSTDTAPVANVVSDTVTTGKVKAAIAADSGMKDADISVTTSGGAVMLSGSVKSRDQVTIASSLAQRQEGVQRVDASAVQVK